MGTGRGGEDNPPVHSPSFKNVEFLSDITSRLFYFPVFVGFQAPGLTECPRNRLKDEAGTEECEARIATAD